MIARLLELLGPPYDLPSWKEAAVVIALVALGRGWYDEHQKYEDMVEVAKAAGANVEECRVVGARLKLTEERVQVAEDRHAVLLIWLQNARIRVPDEVLAEGGG